MRGVWGVVGWLMRKEKKGKGEKGYGGAEKEAQQDLTHGGKYRF